MPSLPNRSLYIVCDDPATMQSCEHLKCVYFVEFVLVKQVWSCSPPELKSSTFLEPKLTFL